MPQQSYADPFDEADALLREIAAERQSALTPTLDPFDEADALLAEIAAERQSTALASIPRVPFQTGVPATRRTTDIELPNQWPAGWQAPAAAGIPVPRPGQRTADITLPAEEPTAYRFGFTDQATVQGTGGPITVPSGADIRNIPQVRTRPSGQALVIPDPLASVPPRRLVREEPPPELPRFEESVTVTGQMPSTLETLARLPNRINQGVMTGLQSTVGQGMTAAASMAYPDMAQAFQAAREAGELGLEQAGITAPSTLEMSDPQWWAAGLGQAIGSAAGLALAARMGGTPFSAAAMATTAESMTEAAGVYNRLLSEGKSQEDAMGKAVGTFSGNMVALGLTNHPMFAFGGSFFKRALLKSQLEGAQEVVQTGIGNVAMGRPVREGAAEAYAIGSMGGGVFGATEKGPPARAPRVGLAAPERRLTAPEIEAIFAQADAELAATSVEEPPAAPPIAPPPPGPPEPPPLSGVERFEQEKAKLKEQMARLREVEAQRRAQLGLPTRGTELLRQEKEKLEEQVEESRRAIAQLRQELGLPPAPTPVALPPEEPPPAPPTEPLGEPVAPPAVPTPEPPVAPPGPPPLLPPEPPITPPAKTDIATPPPGAFRARLFQGRGKPLEQVYSPEAVKGGWAVPVFGPGEYYAHDPKEAEHYGAVTEQDVALNRPFVIASDRKWFDLLEKAGALGLAEPSATSMREGPRTVREQTARLQQYLKDQGYDGIVAEVSWENDDTKKLRRLIGHSQVVVFEPTAKPSIAPTGAAPPVAPAKLAAPPKAAVPVALAATYLPQRPAEDVAREQAREIVRRASTGDFSLGNADLPTLRAVLDQIKASPAGFPDLQETVEERLAILEEQEATIAGAVEGITADITGAPEGAEAFVRDYVKTSGGPDILEEIARHGGISPTALMSQGEMDWMKAGAKFGRIGGVNGVIRKKGLTLEYMAHVLSSTYPEFFGDITAGHHLIDRIAHEVRQSGTAGRYRKTQPPSFQEPIGPMFDEPAEPAKPSPPVAAAKPAESMEEYAERLGLTPLELDALSDIDRESIEAMTPEARRSLAKRLLPEEIEDQATEARLIAESRAGAEAEQAMRRAADPRARIETIQREIADRYPNQPKDGPNAAQEVEALAAEEVRIAREAGIPESDLSPMAQAYWREHPPADEQVDVLETGEAQPRLPEAGQVREQDIATPTFEAPFALGAQVGKAKKTEQPSMFGDEEGAPAPRKPSPPVAPRKKSGQDTLFERIETAPAAEPTGAPTPVAAAAPPLKDTDAGGSTTRAPFYLPPRAGRAAATGAPLKPSEIVTEIQDLFKVPVRTGRFREKAHGIYKVFPRVIRTKIANDLGTLAHELGHHIDKALLRGVPQDLYRAELERLGLQTSSPSADLDTKLAEGIAEYWRLRFGDREEAIRQAPIYHQAIEDALVGETELRGAIARAQRRFDDYLAQDLTIRAKLRLDYTGTEEEADGRTFLARVEQRWIDDYSDIRRMVEDLGGGGVIDAVKSGYALARLARGYADKATGFLKFGVRDDSGRLTTTASLEKALEMVKGNRENFGAYLAAVHALERNAAGKRSGITNAEAKALIADYETDTFKEAAKLVYEFQDKMLDYAVEGDILTPAQARNFRKAYQAHVPLFRVKKGGSMGRAIGLQLRPSAYRAAHGGGEDIINPLEGLVRQTHEIVKAVEQKRALYALVQQALTTEGGGKYIEEVPPKMQKEVLRGGQIIEMIERAKGDDVEVKLLTTTIEGEEHVEDLNPGDKFERWKVAMFQNNANDYVLAIQHQGDLRVFQMDKAIYDAVTIAGPSAADEVIKLYSKATNLLRKGATLSVGFILRNPIRDTWTAAVQSKYGFVLGYDTMKGLFSYLKKDEAYQLYMQSGAGQSAFYAKDRTELRRELKRLKGESWRDVAQNPRDLLRALNPVEFLTRVSGAGEQATRLGEFRRAIKAEGLDVDAATRLGAELDTALAEWAYANEAAMRGERESGLMQAERNLDRARTAYDVVRAQNARALAAAGMAARDVTLDFQRAGRRGRPFNQVVAFLNANIQGYDRMVRTFKDDPAGATFRATLSITLPSIALWALNHDDDEYREIPEWERKVYWHVPLRIVGGTGFIRVPKPFELGMIFGTSFEKALDHITGEDPDAWRKLFSSELYAGESVPLAFAKDRAKALAQSIIPTTVIPMLEAWANYSTFRERPLISPFEEKHLDPPQQYTRWTSETAKFLGRVTNTAPVKWDHLISGYGGGLGREALQLAEFAVKPVLGGPARPAKGISAVPGVSALYREPAGTSAQSLVEFYQLRDALDKIAGVAKDEPEPGGSKRAKQVALETRVTERLAAGRLTHVGKMQITNARDLLAIRTRVNAAATGMTEIRDEINALFKNPTMTAQEKRAGFDRAYTDMLNLARGALRKAPLDRPWLTTKAPVPVAAAK